MSEHRRLEVLRAIVEDYVHSREPVGSKALVERHQLGVSSATIRNDMAALEDEGLIAAPHTSAGRIPTDKGYRTFVDRITEVKPLSQAERRAINRLLAGANDIEDVLDRTARTLAHLTGQVAVAQFPDASGARVRHVELVLLTAGKLLLVLILDTGKVEQRVVDITVSSAQREAARGGLVDEDALSSADLATIRTAFLQALTGVAVTELPMTVETVSRSVPASLSWLADVVAEGLVSLAYAVREDRFVVAGIANLARSDVDFLLSIGPVLDALEEQVVMLRLLSEMVQDPRGVAVSIGRENPWDSLTETSVVATSYGPGSSAKVGVLGPTRMDYPGSMAAVRAVASYLSRILAG